LGELEHLEGNHDRASELIERSVAIAAEIGFAWWEGVMLAYLSEFAFDAGRPADAQAWGRRSLERLRAVGDRQNLIYGLAILAWAAAEHGDTRRAGVLWGAIDAEESRGPVGQWETERERYEAVVADAGAAFAEARREGRGLRFERAIDLAITGSPTAETPQVHTRPETSL
jgi:hypothetical protein